MNPVEDDAGIATGELKPLGTLAHVEDVLARFNTAPDGSERRQTGTAILHGPGIVVEIPTGLDRVNQIMVSINDEELAFTVLWRLCKEQGWKLIDAETGQKFG